MPHTVNTPCEVRTRPLHVMNRRLAHRPRVTSPCHDGASRSNRASRSFKSPVRAVRTPGPHWRRHDHSLPPLQQATCRPRARRGRRSARPPHVPPTRKLVPSPGLPGRPGPAGTRRGRGRGLPGHGRRPAGGELVRLLGRVGQARAGVPLPDAADQHRRPAGQRGRHDHRARRHDVHRGPRRRQRQRPHPPGGGGDVDRLVQRGDLGHRPNIPGVRRPCRDLGHVPGRPPQDRRRVRRWRTSTWTYRLVGLRHSRRIT